MARASYLVSARAMALGTPPLAWFYAAAWSVFTPPLTGINVQRHLVKVYAIAGLLAGLAGIVTAARAETAQAGMGMM